MKTPNKLSFAFFSFLIYSLLTLSACSNNNKMTIKSEYKSVAFHTFKTYQWYKKSGFDKDGMISQITYDYFKESIEKELKHKQLTKLENTNVDFFINVTFKAETQVDVKNYQVYSGIGEGFRVTEENEIQQTAMSESKTDYIYYKKGILLIDIIDPTTDKLIWRGTAIKRLPKTFTSSQQRMKDNIDIAVSAVLAKFPPK